MSKYDDIIQMDRPVSKKHKPMSLINRAAQFAPFAALTGYDGVILETGRETENKIELDEYEMSDLNNQLMYLVENRDVVATFTFFIKDKYKAGGKNVSSVGSIKKADLDNQRIILSDETIIYLDDLTSIEI